MTNNLKELEDLKELGKSEARWHTLLWRTLKMSPSESYELYLYLHKETFLLSPEQFYEQFLTTPE